MLHNANKLNWVDRSNWAIWQLQLSPLFTCCQMVLYEVICLRNTIGLEHKILEIVFYHRSKLGQSQWCKKEIAFDLSSHKLIDCKFKVLKPLSYEISCYTGRYAYPKQRTSLTQRHLFSNHQVFGQTIKNNWRSKKVYGLWKVVFNNDLECLLVNLLYFLLCSIKWYNTPLSSYQLLKVTYRPKPVQQ